MTAPRTPTVAALPPEEGVDRCPCGCKYWDLARCVDCGDYWSAYRPSDSEVEAYLTARDAELGLPDYLSERAAERRSWGWA